MRLRPDEPARYHNAKRTKFVKSGKATSWEPKTALVRRDSPPARLLGVGYSRPRNPSSYCSLRLPVTARHLLLAAVKRNALSTHYSGVGEPRCTSRCLISSDCLRDFLV